MRNFLTVILAIALLPVVALAQFDTGGGSGSSTPWKSFKLDPKVRIGLNFRNANADMVLSLFQQKSGITIVKDPALTGGLTITSAKPVSLSDAFQILSTVLSLKNFDLTKENNLLVIRQRAQRGAGMPDMSQFMAQGPGRGDQSVLRVYPIKYANATEVARVLNDVFSPQGQTNNNPFGGRFGGNFGRGAIVMNPGGNDQNSRQPQVRASSDDFSNSVIVNAPPTQQTQVSDLIDKIDKQTDEPQQAKVFKLIYAVSDDLAPVIQNVLVSNQPRGKGGVTAQNTDFQARFQQAIRFGSTSAAFGQVVSDPRTNSLVVTATPENLAIIAEVIDKLDKPVETQPSMFVYPLQSARADQVATLLNQALGSRSGTNPQTSNTQGRTPSTASGSTSRSTNSGRPPTLGGQVNPSNQVLAQNNQSQNELNLALQDPAAQAGELLTSVGVQGGFFGGGFQNRINRGGSSSSSNSQSTGRDEQGRLVNIRDIVGQVTVIADPNTNSIIVVGSPDSAAMVRSILDQLDKIPEQVMIETIIVEATLDSSDKLGVEWSLAQGKVLGGTATSVTSQNFGLQNATPAPTGFKYTLSSGSVSAFINALKTDSKFQILSTPRIFTSNNVQADINISQSIPYVVSSTTDAATGSINYNYSFEDVGVILTVTPHITSNGYVLMDVSQTANDLQGYTSFNAPIVNQRQADTSVSVKDGETIILGGIIRSTVTATTNKIPILGDIPILGKLFQSSSRDKQKTELLVFLTPHVVKGPDDAAKLLDKTTKELSAADQKNVKDLIPKPNPILEGGGH